MKAYKITGKLGDICSFVGGNEVKKGDTVYLQPQREWVGLTDEEITKCAEAEDPIWVAKNVEAKLQEKNSAT